MAYLENHFSDHRKNLCLGHSEVLFVRLSFPAEAFGMLCCIVALDFLAPRLNRGKRKV